MRLTNKRIILILYRLSRRAMANDNPCYRERIRYTYKNFLKCCPDTTLTPVQIRSLIHKYTKDYTEDQELLDNEIDRAEAQKNPYLCLDCGCPLPFLYMVRDKLWYSLVPEETYKLVRHSNKSVRISTNQIHLCLPCLDKRSGYKLTIKDVSRRRVTSYEASVYEKYITEARARAHVNA